MENYVTKLRRELHSRPEVGFDLDNTLAVIRRELDGMGVEYTEKYGKSSIVATVGENKNAFTVAIRADIDALPIEEKNDVPYKSQNAGKMHACGHDAHTAILLDTVRRVNEIKDEIPYRVKFFFQSAEEYAPGGASLMVRDGVMDGIDEVYALHVAPNVDTGVITLWAGPQNAASNGFYLKFYGVSAHAARKEEGRDAIKMAFSAYFDIEKIAEAHKSAGEKIVFHVGQVEGGKTNNIVANECSLFCTLRTLDDETAEKIIFLAIPVVYYALKLAKYNMQNLPEVVGINLQSNGVFAETISRELAVTGPLGLTCACLVLMVFSRKALYPWAVSVFTLALPVLLLLSNLYPA